MLFFGAPKQAGIMVHTHSTAALSNIALLHSSMHDAQAAAGRATRRNAAEVSSIMYPDEQRRGGRRRRFGNRDEIFTQPLTQNLGASVCSDKQNPEEAMRERALSCSNNTSIAQQ